MKKLFSIIALIAVGILSAAPLSGGEWVTIQNRVDRFVPTETGGGIAACVDPSDVECEMELLKIDRQ